MLYSWEFSNLLTITKTNGRYQEPRFDPGGKSVYKGRIHKRIETFLERI